MAWARAERRLRRNVKRAERREERRRPKAAPYSMLDRLDRKTGRATPNTPRRDAPRLNRQTAKLRRERAALNRGEPIRVRGGHIQVKNAGGDVVTLTPTEYRRLAAAGRRAVAGNRALAGTQYRDDRLKPGPRKRGGAGGLPLASAGLRDLMRAVNTSPAGDTLGEVTDVVGRAGQDLVSLPKNTVVGAYHTGSALAQATPIPGVKGSDTTALKALLNELKNTDPIILAAQGRFGEAAEAAWEHPALTGLEFAGGVGTASRVGAKAGRKAGAKSLSRDRGRRRVKVEHPDARAPKITERRRYHEGAIGKVREVRGENKARKSTARLNRLAQSAEGRGDFERARTLRTRAADRDPDRMPEEEIRRRVDLIEGQNQSMRRPGRGETASAVRALLPKKGGEAVSLVTQRIAHADRRDLLAYHRELEAQADGMTETAKLAANRRLRTQIENVLDGDADMALVGRAADDYARVVNPLERELVGAGMLHPHEAQKSKLIPYAVRRMGAYLDKQPRPTSGTEAATRYGALAARADAAVKRADRELEIARRVEAKAEGRAEVQASVGRRVGKRTHKPDRRRTDLTKAQGERLMKAQEDRMLAQRRAEQARQVLDQLEAAARDEKQGKRSYTPGLVDAGGRRLSPERIRMHMRSEEGGGPVDPDLTAFVSHSSTRLGDRSYNVTSREAPGIPRRARSGEAVREGRLDLDPERLVEQAVQMRGLAEANRAWGRNIDELALRSKDGKVMNLATRKEMQDLVDDLMFDPEGHPIPGAHKWRVIRLNPWNGRQEQLQRLIDEADEEGFVVDDNGKPAHPISEAVEKALDGEGDGPGEWGAIPEVAAQRMQEHAGVVRSSGPAARAVTQAFRKTVLSMSPSWLTGNVGEGGLRTAIFGAGPRSWVDFRRVHNLMAVGDQSYRRALTKKLPKGRPGSLEEQLLHTLPGGHYGGTNDTLIHISAQQFENSRLAPVARAGAALARKPGPKQVATMWRRYTDWMFGTFNAGIESQFTRAMAGKHIRTELMSRKDRQVGETAIEQAARGLKNTDEQIAMADGVRRAYGQYDSMSPAMRRWILTYTPFGAWALNAAKFLVNVLPRDHPGITALLAANQQLSEDWLAENHLDPWAEDSLPAFLHGSIPLPGGGHLRAAKYTPFGLMASPLEAVSSTVLPQFMGPLMAFRGLDWRGDPIRADGKPVTDPFKLAGIAAKEFAFATVPGIGIATRLAEKGPSTLNPLNPVKPKKEKGAAPGSAEAILEKHGLAEKQGPSAAEILEKHGVK